MEITQLVQFEDLSLNLQNPCKTMYSKMGL